MVHWEGVACGAVTFLLIGLFHPIVVKAEYHFGKKIWSLFAIIGTVSLIISLFLADTIASVMVAVFGITCLWSVKELFEQEERVAKGWFPKNPHRHGEP